jgi:hypothetical protein
MLPIMYRFSTFGRERLRLGVHRLARKILCDSSIFYIPSHISNIVLFGLDISEEEKWGRFRKDFLIVSRSWMMGKVFDAFFCESV